jgi:hypothetical protein
MKSYIYALVFILLLSGVTAADYCQNTCLDNTNTVLSTHTLYGGDNAIMNANDVVVSSAYDWKLGEAVYFSLEYDPLTSVLTYTIDGNVLQTTVSSSAFNYIVLQGQASSVGSNTITFTDLMMDGTAITDFEVTSGTEGVKIDPQHKFFKLQGRVMMNGEDDINKNIAGMNIYLLNSIKSGNSKSASTLSADAETAEIPEFGVVAALIALFGAIAVFAIKRKD